jgi:5-methyltetrahydropteroyltriglutamate--homocysteine methyltransferase
VLQELGDKDVLLGTIDVGTEDIETADVVAGRIRQALEYVPASRLFPCTDCGLVPRSRDASRGKMRALAAGSALVRAELAEVDREAIVGRRSQPVSERRFS